MPKDKDAQRARAQERQEREAALQKRRTARAIGVAALLTVLVVVAVLSSTGGDGGDGENASDDQSPAAGEVACGAEAPPPADPQQYDAPEQVLEEGVDYGAVISTSCGDIEIDLAEETAPETVNNFVFLAREGFYDGLIWHRVINNFVIQGGDPDGVNGQEPDGPGYSIKDELPEQPSDYVYGVLAMANAGPNSGGSQFFIVVAPEGQAAGLNPDFSIFGQASEASAEALDAIAKLETSTGAEDPSEQDKPINPAYIESIEITES